MDTAPPSERVAGMVALKTLPAAKSRLSLPAPLRQRLARCMALDTIAALGQAVDQLLVISDQPGLGAALRRHGLPARVIAEPSDSSLNGALSYGDRLLRQWGWGVVVACVGDLPALRPISAQRVIAAAAAHRRGFLADLDDRGTTMLVARGVPLEPRYGSETVAGRTIGSAERHRRSGAEPLPLADLLDARCDVDTLADLRRAHPLGLGPATRQLVDPGTGMPGRYRRVDVVDRDATTVWVRADGVVRPVGLDATDGDPALIVRGRRLHAVLVAGTLSCWS